MRSTIENPYTHNLNGVTVETPRDFVVDFRLKAFFPSCRIYYSEHGLHAKGIPSKLSLNRKLT